MSNTSGRKRVIINNILPAVDRGQYPAKVTIDQPVIISADIFTDGIDAISANVLLKQPGARQWQEFPLTLINNDRWEASFTPAQLGVCQFQVQAWINSYVTWQENIRKKYEAGQDISVDLKAGVQIVQEHLTRATGKNRETLTSWMNELDSVTDNETGYQLSRNSDINILLCKCRDKGRLTVYPQVFELWVEPLRAKFSTWYELFPRSTAMEPGAHGTFNDVRRLLPRLEKMGFDVLYLPPIHPIGTQHRKGRNNSLTPAAGDPGSPWAIGNKEGGHKAIHPQLGTLKNFRTLIEDARKKGIEIAMDIAFQCSPDHPYVKEHPQWFRWRADGTVQFAENPPKKYEDILPFDFESEDWMGLWEELRSVIKYWVDNGVTIFRVDNPHTKALPFWEWAIADLKAEHPELIFLAEAFTRPRIMEQLAKAGFTQSYTYFAWRNTKREIQEYVTELTQTDLQYYFHPNFWPNTPDILTAELVHGGENAHIQRLILAATLSSNYGVYGPVYEQVVNDPMPGKEEYNDNEKYEIKTWDWDKYTKTREIMTRLNRMRNSHKALQDTNNILFAETDNDHIICYIKADREKEDIMIIAVNLDAHNTQSGMVKLPLYKIGMSYDKPYTVHDLLSGDKYLWQGDYNYVSLNPHDMPAHIFRVIQ